MRVIVLGGGDSTERAVSLRSAAAIAAALEAAGHTVITLDPKNGLNELDSVAGGAIIFPILHGEAGEDGKIQQELENRNLPYLGTKSAASAICFDKSKTRQVLQKVGLPVAEGGLVTSGTYPSHPLHNKPHVLKVTTGGSSIGTYVVKDPNNINLEKVEEVFKLGTEAVIEDFVEGVEITVPVLDTEALPVVEIQVPAGVEFDYENKYNGMIREVCPPVSVTDALQKEAQALALRAHTALNCRHLSRTDMIIRPNGEIIILEVNTMPGMTNQSLYPVSAATAGLSMPELADSFVALVSRDYGINK